MTVSISYVVSGYWDDSYSVLDSTSIDYFNVLNLDNSTTSLILVIDGVQFNVSDVTDDLPRAILISLFTWRRANSDDDLPNLAKFGWWGDTFSTIQNDKIGSRLWLLSRNKLTTETISKTEEYASEALNWLIEDKVADSVQVKAERLALDILALQITITRGDSALLNIRFINVWDYLNAI
ncbi:MAG: phage GP46 family protein [Methylococcales bacterium]|nr:phage GP46 family protein [Methylococcales bacterium]